MINQIGRKIFGKCCNFDGYWSSHQVLIKAIEEAAMLRQDNSFISRLMHEDMTNQELIDNMKMLYFAGTETTGSLITSALGHLSANKEEEQKLILELQGITLDDLDFDTLHRLKRLKACVYESLRLIPPLPIQIRRIKEENYTYYIDHYHRLRDSSHVGANPDLFIPDRFADESLYAEVEKVFGEGLTPCIGKHFALTETLLLLASIFLHGSLTLVEGDPYEVIMEAGAPLLASKNQIVVNLLYIL